MPKKSTKINYKNIDKLLIDDFGIISKLNIPWLKLRIKNFLLLEVLALLQVT